MALRPPMLFTLLLAIPLAGPAAAVPIVIDDFEEGAFNLVDSSTTPGATFAEQSGLTSSSVVGGVRLVAATGGGTLEAPGTASATLVTDGLDDAVALTATSTGDISFFYDGNADGAPQTTDGSLGIALSGDRFQVEFATLNSANAQFRITLWDSDSVSNSLVHDPVLGSVDVFYSEFSGIDFSDIRTIRLNVSEIVNGQSLSITHFVAVPEPGTGLLLAAGLVAVAVRRRVAR